MNLSRNSSLLSRDFYIGQDPVLIAKALLGKTLRTSFNNELTEGIIVETEAYKGPEDQASHARNGLRSQRNIVMYDIGGCAYVYLIYGIHSMFNIVTASMDLPHAVLIRAVQPVRGEDIMRRRRCFSKNLTSGPGVLTRALGIQLSHNGMDLTKPDALIQIHLGKEILEKDILSRKRVGIEYAGKWSSMPWRFSIKGNSWVSKAK